MEVDIAIVTALISATSGLVGVATGGWLAGRHYRIERRNQRMSEQLSGFYAPMLGIRAWILAKSELRVKIQGAAGDEWQRLVAGAKGEVGALIKISEERSPDFKKIIEENNRQLVEELLPKYHDMVKVFSENLALAEPSTIEHFGALVEFVELWDRWLEGTVPAEVTVALEHGEENLHPLYADLSHHFARLQSELQG